MFRVFRGAVVAPALVGGWGILESDGRRIYNECIYNDDDDGGAWRKAKRVRIYVKI